MVDLVLDDLDGSLFGVNLLLKLDEFKSSLDGSRSESVDVSHASGDISDTVDTVSLDTLVLGVLGVPSEWVTGSAVLSVLGVDPAASLGGLDALTGLDLEGVAGVASDASGLVSDNGGTPLAVWNWVVDLLAGGFWLSVDDLLDGVESIGTGNADVRKSGELNLDETVLDDTLDTVDQTGAVSAWDDVLSEPWLADLAGGGVGDPVDAIDGAGVVGWLEFATALVVLEVLSEVALVAGSVLEDLDAPGVVSETSLGVNDCCGRKSD